VALNLAKAEGRHHGDGLQLRGGHHVAAGGPHTTFAITKQGPEVTEVYVYAAGDRGERENFGPGTTRDLAVTLDAGNYDVACKPKMTGDGIRTKITVTK
jgi:iron uptake system component EfeO